VRSAVSEHPLARGGGFSFPPPFCQELFEFLTSAVGLTMSGLTAMLDLGRPAWRNVTSVPSRLSILAAAFGFGEGGLFTSRCLVGQPFFVVHVVSAFAWPAQVDLVVGLNDTPAWTPCGAVGRASR